MLVPWRVERIVHDDTDVLVVDKPAGIVVHGGNEVLRDDLVQRLGAWLTAQDRHDYLGVHQRLDQATSGLLFFTRERARNREIAAAMEQHRIRRTYLAVVSLANHARLQKKGRLEHRLVHDGGMTRVVQRGGQHAVTQYEILDRRGDRALLQLEPQTGRTHQLRVQLKETGAPICGDRLYDGEPAPRLMLHAAALEGEALGGAWTSDMPPQFQSFLERGVVDVPEDLSPLLREAGLRRWALAQQASAYRLVNGSGDLLPGVVVDVYGSFAVLSLYEEHLVSRATELAQQLAAFGFEGVYLKIRVKADLRRQVTTDLAAEVPLVGNVPADPVIVLENGMRFEVALGDGLSTGLFVDQRDNRERVRQSASGRRVLNLFSYTCSFSVAAALGGAQEVVSVDLSRRALDRGRGQFELNGLDPANHKFFKEDAVKWLGRAERRGERFDLIVLDPPSFSTVGKGTFSVQRQYGDIAAAALKLLNPGGRLLAVTNHNKTSARSLRKILHEAAARAGRSLRTLRDAPSGLDCPEGPEGPWPSKSAWATVQ